jgi:GrpB-like predicted nucleotidyltransferase (UPF0157 family)
VGGAVVIVEYDPRWPRRFEEEKARLVAAIGPRVVAVEHSGARRSPASPPNRSSIS